MLAAPKIMTSHKKSYKSEIRPAKGSILVAYVPEEVANPLVEYITSEGYDIDVFPTITQMIENEDGAYSIALVDISPDGAKPIHAIELIMQMTHDSSIPVLVTSDTPNTEKIIQALNSGAMDYIIRPYSKHELLQRIRSIINR